MEGGREGGGERQRKEGDEREEREVGWGWEGAGAVKGSWASISHPCHRKEIKKYIYIHPICNYPAKDKSKSVPWYWLGLLAAPQAKHTMPCWKTETHMCTY